MSGYYRRDGTQYKSVVEWAKDFETADRIVGRTDLKSGGYVSTVWLGLNHQFGDGPPLIFETMVFDADGNSLDQSRYSTEQQAIDGHAATVAEFGG